MVKIQKCMIYHCVRTNELVKMIYHTIMYFDYDQRCDHFYDCIFVCTIAELPDFSNVEKGQVDFQEACKSGVF